MMMIFVSTQSVGFSVRVGQLFAAHAAHPVRGAAGPHWWLPLRSGRPHLQLQLPRFAVNEGGKVQSAQLEAGRPQREVVLCTPDLSAKPHLQAQRAGAGWGAPPQLQLQPAAAIGLPEAFWLASLPGKQRQLQLAEALVRQLEKE